MQHILGQVRRCVEDYHMIEAGDKVAVGVSGGKDSLLTLTDEELGQTDLHFLIHGWAFYPGVLLTPEEWAAHGTEHYMIYTSIGERTRFDQPDGVTPHGCGTYVLTLELPEKPAQYGLELPEIYSAYRLYLNGNLELQVGEPDLEHYQPRTQNRMLTFTGSGLTTILLAVRDDSHFYSGLVYPPALGTPLAVNLSRGLRLGLAVCVTLCGVLGAALAAYFGEYDPRRSRDHSGSDHCQTGRRGLSARHRGESQGRESHRKIRNVG